MIYDITAKKPLILNSGVVVKFSGGGPAFQVASSAFTHVSYRGIQTRLTPLVDGGKLVSDGWSTVPCYTSAWGLCQYDHGLILGDTPHPVVGVENQRGFCADGTGQQMGGSDVFRYDYSACDVVDESLQIVFSPLYQQVFLRYTPISTLYYWVLVLTSIYIIRELSLDVVDRLHVGKDSKEKNKGLDIAWTWVVWSLMLWDGQSFYLTDNDRVFYWLNMSYLLYYLLWHSYHWVCHWRSHGKYKQPRIFNMFIITIQTIISRLYSSAPTPYAVPVVAFLCIRLYEKYILRQYHHMYTGLMDCIYIGMVLKMTLDMEIAYMFPLFAICRLLSERYVAGYTQQKQKI